MRRTLLAAGLLAALAGTGLLAQETSPDSPTRPGPRFGFAMMDADGDGIVTREEMEARHAGRLAEADADGDGAISAEEMLAMQDRMREEARLAMVEAMIARMDDNGDGRLQPEEAEARTPRLAPMFDALDRNGDGGISEDEMPGPQGWAGGPGGGWGMMDGWGGDPSGWSGGPSGWGGPSGGWGMMGGWNGQGGDWGMMNGWGGGARQPE